MIRLPLAIALLVLSMTACGRNAPAPATSTQSSKPAATAPAPTAAKPADEVAGPESQTSESKEATASQESTGEEAADDKRDASLERLAAMPSDQQLPVGQWKPGVNYTPVVPAQPTSVAAGKVEVIEVFWYACPHCYALEPFIQNWLQNKPEYVQFVRVPVMWGPVHRAHAKLYYVLESLNRKDLHAKVFDSIHKEQQILVGNDEASTKTVQLNFAVANGIKAEDFNKAWDSFTVNSNLQRAEELTTRYRVEGVPLMIVNGKYTTDVSHAGGAGQLLSLVNDLAASEKRK